MRNKKKNRIYFLLILLLGISIGFAALATTLKINGTANIGKNTWDVHWANVGDIQKSSTTTITTGAKVNENDSTEVDFEVTLNQPGDYYEFQVDAVNAGTLDAMANIVSKTTVPSYASLTVKYADGEEINKYDLLAKAPDLTADPPVYTTERIKVRIEFLSDIDPEDLAEIGDNESIDIAVEVPYDQADDNARDRHIPVPTDFATDEWDVIAAEGNEAAKQTSTDGSCGAYNLGDTKSVDMGTLGTHTVRIINCSTPAICSTEGFSQTACGFVIEFYDTIGEKKMNNNGSSNAGGWNTSEIRAYLNGGTTGTSDYSEDNVLSKLPSALQSLIDDQTYIVSSHGSTDSSNFTLRDSLFVASAGEIWENVGTNWDSIANNDSAYSQTRQFDYYKNLGVTATNYSGAAKQYTGGVSYVWTRSASTGYSDSYITVNQSGDPFISNMARNNCRIAPAFKLK